MRRGTIHSRLTRHSVQRRLFLLGCSTAATPWWLAQAAAAPVAATPVAANAIKVVTTFSILADMVREVGGAEVEVTALVGPNADAHVFEPTPADVRRMARADLVVTNGLRFEGWIDRLITSSGYRGPVVIASRGVATRQLAGGADPHAWQDLAHGQRYAENIRAALVGVASASRQASRPATSPASGVGLGVGLGELSAKRVAAVNIRAAAYQQRLAHLDRDIRARINAVPAERRRVITSHDAFGYFAAAYGITFIAPRGWTTGSEPSAAAVAGIVRLARESKASALLVENISDPRLIERIGREAALKVGGKLYSDALSPPGTEADTYLRMFEHNVRTLVDAMGVRR